MCLCVQIYIYELCVVCFPSLFNFAVANISLLGIFFSRSPFHIPANWMEISIIHLLDFINRYTHARNWCWTIFAQRQTNICTGDQASKRCLAIAHMPRSMSVVVVAVAAARASATTNIQICLIIINSKFKWGNFTHFTQCELAARLVGLSPHTCVCVSLYDSQRAKKTTQKYLQQTVYTTIRSSNRRKNLYNNQNELHKTLQFHTNNFQWMIWMFLWKNRAHTHIVVRAEKLRAETTTNIGALQMRRTVSFVHLICFTYCCCCCCRCRYIHQFKQTFLNKYITRVASNDEKKKKTRKNLNLQRPLKFFKTNTHTHTQFKRRVLIYCHILLIIWRRRRRRVFEHQYVHWWKYISNWKDTRGKKTDEKNSISWRNTRGPRSIWSCV